jgi:5-formyltetrahydrofolate cyclo-ligase
MGADMSDLTDVKQAARTAAFARRKVAHATAGPGLAGRLSEVLAGYRGVPLAGYMAMRTEIDPLPAMAEAAAHGLVSVPVIMAAGQPLWFSRWEPDAVMKDGAFGAMIPATEDFFAPEILIVPLVAFDLSGGRLGYGGGFYDRSLEGLRKVRATMAIGFAFDAQQADDLPLEGTDQPLDMVVTETRVLNVRGR